MHVYYILLSLLAFPSQFIFAILATFYPIGPGERDFMTLLLLVAFLQFQLSSAKRGN